MRGHLPVLDLRLICDAEADGANRIEPAVAGGTTIAAVVVRAVRQHEVGSIMAAVLTELQRAAGEAKLKDLLDRAEVKPHLMGYEREPYANSGYIRWRALVHFYSIDCVKAGYLQKSGGKWYLTPAGEEALRQPLAYSSTRPGEISRLEKQPTDTHLTGR
ncbi:MAG TPA: winged helix-turn-helix domain-containing protein [Candidatus Tectomicrobia bacterium]|nr:winged helix-turn-helix domain-containing protein [Candidatus Tectomicrobia bacterium]